MLWSYRYYRCHARDIYSALINFLVFVFSSNDVFSSSSAVVFSHRHRLHLQFIKTSVREAKLSGCEVLCLGVQKPRLIRCNCLPTNYRFHKQEISHTITWATVNDVDGRERFVDDTSCVCRKGSSITLRTFELFADSRISAVAKRK